ncbi:MAG: hypothetical protein LBM93_02090, partial [Oscillospiraceae bacterium]|nr:hypothetical protein [Oscillospiraceae bacterium]
MNIFNFYYDESEHSRKINYNTVTAENYCDCFITAIVGWNETDEKILCSEYLNFEQKYSDRKSNGELKSGTIRQSQLKYGFASLNNDNIKFIEDFLSLFNKKTYIYYCLNSKIEYIIKQIFENYENSLIYDMDILRYSTTKAIITYKPVKVLSSIYGEPEYFVDALKEFFKERIELNQNNINLKYQENKIFEQILFILHNTSSVKELNWSYSTSFIGFRNYLDENLITEYSLCIDKEGENSNTLNSAIESGIKNVFEADSKTYFGIRIADMLCGIIGKLVKSLDNDFNYATEEDTIKKNLLSIEWFQLNERQLNLYKKLYSVLIEINKSWYKAFSGYFSDDLVTLIALANFMNHYNTIDEINGNLKMQPEYFNGCATAHLSEYFERLQNSHLQRIKPLPVDAETNGEKEFTINRRGAKVYYDVSKHPYLPIKDGANVYDVLSVGIHGANATPIITINESGKAFCYRLPHGLSEWAMTAVGFANLNEHMFPSN